MKRVLTRAYANIALCKYWGKMPGDGEGRIGRLIFQCIAQTTQMPFIGAVLEQLRHNHLIQFG